MATIFPPVSLTVQLTPGTKGTRHLLQYLKSEGIFALVFLLMLLANETYLLARSSLPSAKASFDSPVSIEIRSSPILTTAFLEIRLLDMFPEVSYDTDIKIICSFSSDYPRNKIYNQEANVLSERKNDGPLRGRVLYGNHSVASLRNYEVEYDLDIPKDDNNPDPDKPALVVHICTSYRVGSGPAR